MQGVKGVHVLTLIKAINTIVLYSLSDEGALLLVLLELQKNNEKVKIAINKN